jgi:hypothetical protein
MTSSTSAAVVNNAHTAKLQRQIEAFQSRVQESVEKIADNFGSILRAAQIHDSLTNTREAYQIEVHASNICHACDSLLLLITELKRHYVLCADSNVARDSHFNFTDVPLVAEATASSSATAIDEDL